MWEKSSLLLTKLKINNQNFHGNFFTHPDFVGKAERFFKFKQPIGDLVSICPTSSVEVNPEIVTFIKSNLSNGNFFSDMSPEGFNNIIRNITQGANNDINVIKRRLKIVNNRKHTYIVALQDETTNNAGFMLDNFDIILEKILLNRNLRHLGPDVSELVKILSKDNLQDVIKHINNDDFIIFATKLIYNSKKHNVKMGTETVKIDSSEIIALLSARNSLSFYETGGSVFFNRAINRLTEVTHRVESDEICPYYKIAEGILKQRPDLAKIAKEYQTYMSKIENGEKISYVNVKKFFTELETSGRLPHEIELKTVVPDENALVRADYLLDEFIKREAVIL